jgi:uncharacterized protein (TIGR03067 family)
MRRCVLLSLIVLSLAFAPAPLPTRPARKPPELQIFGSWKQVNVSTVTLVVTHDSLTYVNSDRAPSAYGARFDAARRPMTYDLLRGQGVAFVGIYKIEGDRLTLYYRGGSQNRPTSFEQGGAHKEEFTRVR